MTLLKQHTEKNGEREILQNYQLDEGKGVRKETIYFYF